MGRVITVEVDQVGPSTSKGTARTHSVMIDRPVEKGGGDWGPLGGELIMMAERGCLVTNTLRDAAVVTVELAS